jgi:hypothetical protein
MKLLEIEVEYKKTRTEKGIHREANARENYRNQQRGWRNCSLYHDINIAN